MNNDETRKHILNVVRFVGFMVGKMMENAISHDASKLEDPEVKLFDKYVKGLSKSDYGSKKYNRFLKALKPALDHHYAHNRHHPEHYENGIEGMTLVDLVEMFCDWKSSTLRHENGDLMKSIEHNVKRFNISPQLGRILKNTAEMIEKEYYE